jgi:hypothetical protein
MVGHAALYDQVLYQELSAVPTGFAFRLMKIARDLQSVALEFVSAAAAQSGVSCPNREARCYLKLYVAALRGICYAAATTAFFPQNWRFEKERDNAWAILDFVRSRTSVSRRDILVKYPRLSAKTRDPLLEVLAGLHLIELEGSAVHAIALKDYLSRIPSRAGFPSADLDFRPRMRNRSRF